MASSMALDVPPSYSDLPPSELCLIANSYCNHPVSLLMKGEYRSPDFTLFFPDERPWYRFGTDSTLVYHETFVKDLAQNSGSLTIKRKDLGGLWRYTIHAPGREGQKLLEVDTTPRLMSKSSTRLIFRDVKTSQLDELFMKIDADGSHKEVLYREETVADIIDIPSRYPQYKLEIHRAGLDPLLVMIMAYVVDDRLMTTRRRNRRSLTAGLPGIGKGPGAGLAGAYALTTF